VHQRGAGRQQTLEGERIEIVEAADVGEADAAAFGRIRIDPIEMLEARRKLDGADTRQRVQVLRVSVGARRGGERHDQQA
jgi:hypothetical protein